jgi:hypothetical protein
MKGIRWAIGVGRSWSSGDLSDALPKSVPTDDPRASRYLATAAGYNRAAEEMGYRSLQDAITAGRMSEIISACRGDIAPRTKAPLAQGLDAGTGRL